MKLPTGLMLVPLTWRICSNALQIAGCPLSCLPLHVYGCPRKFVLFGLLRTAARMPLVFICDAGRPDSAARTLTTVWKPIADSESMMMFAGAYFLSAAWKILASGLVPTGESTGDAKYRPSAPPLAAAI